MPELLPLCLRVFAVLDVGLLLAVSDEPRVTVVVNFDDRGIEVRIGSGVVLRSGSEQGTNNSTLKFVKEFQIYELHKDKIVTGSYQASLELKLKFNYASLQRLR